MSTIALLTDFGTQDWYVAAMKAVMLRICPRAQFVDISHAVTPGDIRQAAFVLLSSYSYFPDRTVFLIVVDPGVGSERDVLVAETDSSLVVAPDNGVASYMLKACSPVATCRGTNSKFMLSKLSTTFHGRDIFAPIAAHLAAGVAPAECGDPLPHPVELAWPEATITSRELKGEVVYIDRFGNAITSIDTDRLQKLPPGVYQAYLPNGMSLPVHAYYQEVAAGMPLAITGSGGLIEISINQGNAARRLGLHIGSCIALK
ncbi:MAG: hypothetical protein GF398_01260 [Chitinivibrionales bacterium]|nr:hypothetical protein [Chitinivibrionales bacterium]